LLFFTYKHIINRWLAEKNIVLENIIELGNTETVKSCVSGDLGITLLPRFAVAAQLADGTLKALDSDLSREHITAVCTYHKNKWITPAMELFLRLTREHFSTLDGKS
jgi:DNA-binding transcriptional LysR family regulator